MKPCLKNHLFNLDCVWFPTQISISMNSMDRSMKWCCVSKRMTIKWGMFLLQVAGSSKSEFGAPSSIITDNEGTLLVSVHLHSWAFHHNTCRTNRAVEHWEAQWTGITVMENQGEPEMFCCFPGNWNQLQASGFYWIPHTRQLINHNTFHEHSGTLASSIINTKW